MPIAGDTIPAASGVDLTSNPSSLQDGRAQSIVGYINDRQGLLRAVGMFNQPTGLSAVSANAGIYSIPGTIYTLDSLGVEQYTENVGGSLTYPPNFGVTLLLGAPLGFGFSRFISFQGELYVINGTANTRVFNNGTVLAPILSTMGIWNGTAGTNNLAITLNSAATAGLLNGTYQWYITQVDSLGRESSPGAIYPIYPATQTVANKQVTFNLPTGSYNTQIYNAPAAGGGAFGTINLYRTLAGGSVYYRVVSGISPTATTVTDNIADAAASLLPIGPNFGENNPPYPATWVFVHQNRLIMDVFGAGGTGSIPNCSIQMTNVGSATQVANPTGVDGNGNFIATDGGLYQLINDTFHHATAGCSFGSVAAIWLRDQRWVLYGTDATNYQLYYIDARGCVSTGSLVVSNSFVCWLSEDGVYLTSYSGGFNDEKLSGDLDALIFTLNGSVLGRLCLESSFAWFCDNAYCLYIPGLPGLPGSTTFTPGTIWRFDFNARQKGWTSFTPGIVFASATVMTGAKGQVELTFLGRADAPYGIYLFDVHNPAQVIPLCSDRTRVLQVPNEEPHDHWKQLKRFVRFGSGTYTQAVVTVTVDGRSTSYTTVVTPPALAITQGDASIAALVEQEFTDDIVGYVIDVSVALTNATNVAFSSSRLDYVLLSE